MAGVGQADLLSLGKAHNSTWLWLGLIGFIPLGISTTWMGCISVLLHTGGW